MTKLITTGLLVICCALSACSVFRHKDESIRPLETTNEVAKANFRLGIAYLQQGQYEKSLVKLQNALKADKKYSPTYNALGLLYQRIGEAERAEQFFKKSLSLNASNSSTLNNYGQFLCQQKRFGEAEAMFLKAVENPLYETPEIALTNAGTCALRDLNTAKAAAYFRQALEQNPRLTNALVSMSQLSYEAESYLSARGYLQRYLELAPHNASTLWLGIKIERELGDRDTLSSYMLLLKNKFPKSDEARLLEESLTIQR